MNELNELHEDKKNTNIMKEYEKELLHKKLNDELNTGKLTPEEEAVVQRWLPNRQEKQELEPDLEGEPVKLEGTVVPGYFDGICQDLMRLHAKKNHDYGNAAHESYEEFGIISYVITLNHKMKRLKTLTKTGVEQEVKGESIEDTLMDLAAYAIMAIESLRS